MSAPEPVVTGVDFVSLATRDLERAVAFYGPTLGLRRSAYMPERNYAEFETGTVTLGIVNPERVGVGSSSGARVTWRCRSTTSPPPGPSSRHAASRSRARSSTRASAMAFFADPDGNAVMLHHRYAPRTPSG